MSTHYSLSEVNEFSGKVMVLKFMALPCAGLFQSPDNVFLCVYIFVNFAKLRYFSIFLKNVSYPLIPNSDPNLESGSTTVVIVETWSDSTNHSVQLNIEGSADRRRRDSDWAGPRGGGGMNSLKTRRVSVAHLC